MQTTEIVITNGAGELGRQWAEAFHLWLGGLRSESTRRAYSDAWRDLLTFLGEGAQPWRIGRSQIARWEADLRARQLSECTRNQKLSGISSFFIYTMTEYTVISQDGREVPLHGYNPAAGKSLRARINPYGKACAMTLEEVKAFLAAIDRGTLQGLRDYALFITYLFTARRNSELRQLAWGDIEQAGGQVWYTWSGKGRRDQRFELALPAWLAIRAYLQAAGRLESLRPGDYLFVGFDQATGAPQAWPIGLREVGKLLKRYCRLAGLSSDYHVHTLRHTAAYLRRLAGDDLETVSRMLAHSNLSITQIYLHSMEGQQDASWAKVRDLLSL